MRDGEGGFHRPAAPLPARQVSAAPAKGLCDLEARLVAEVGRTAAHDEGFTQRIRDRRAADPEVSEERVSGGMAFLYRSTMAAGVTGYGLMSGSTPQSRRPTRSAHGSTRARVPL